MRKVLACVILSVFFLTSPAWSADISGEWSVSQKNNEGVDDTFDVTIKAAGETLTITGNHSKIGKLSGTGTLKGDAVNMTINAEGATGKGSLTFIYDGNLTGNKMSGTKETKMNASAGGQGGGQGGAAAGGAQSAQSMPQGGAQGASGGTPGGAPGAASGAVSNAWTAVRK